MGVTWPQQNTCLSKYMIQPANIGSYTIIKHGGIAYFSLQIFPPLLFPLISQRCHLFSNIFYIIYPKQHFIQTAVNGKISTLELLKFNIHWFKVFVIGLECSISSVSFHTLNWRHIQSNQHWDNASYFKWGHVSPLLNIIRAPFSASILTSN